jgi:hypothetical protein
LVLGGREGRLVARFNDPIPPPKGRQLVTLKDALNRGHVREFNPDRKEHHWVMSVFNPKCPN